MARFVMGSAWVDVHADTRQLRPEVKRAADDISRDTQIHAKVRLDTTQADTDRDRLRQRIDRTDAKMHISVDDRDVDQGVDRAGGRIRSGLERLGRTAGTVLSRALSSGVEAGASTAASSGSALAGVLASLTAGAAALTIGVLGLVPALQMTAGGFGVALGGGLALVSVLGTVALAFGGVLDALKAHTAMQNQAATSGSRMAAQAQANAVALRNAAEAISDARRRQADVAEQSAQRFRAAEQRVADSVDRTREAQARLNEVRAEAKERIEELARAAAASARDEERARIRLRQARDRLAVIDSHLQTGTGQFSPEDRQRALDAIREAELDLADARDRNTAQQKEATAAAKAGVDGDKQVKAAKKDLVAAVRAQAEAEADLNRVRRDGARAQEDAAIAVARAVRGLSDLRAQQAAQARAATSGTAAAVAWHKAYNELTPAGKRFVDQLLSMRRHVDALKATAQTATLPGVTGFLRDADRLFPIVNRHVGNMGSVVGGFFRRLGEWTRTPLFRAQFTSVLGSVERFTDHVGRAATNALPALLTITKEASPLLEDFGGWLEHISEDFAAWIEQARKSGQLRSFFTDVRTTFRDVKDVGGLVIGIVGDIIEILWDPAKDANTSTLGHVKAVLGDIKAWLDDDGNKEKVRDWISDVKGTAAGLAHDVLPALRTAAGLVNDAIQWVGDHPTATAALISVLAGYKALSGLTGLKLPDLAKAALGALLQRGNTKIRPLYVEVVNGGVIGGGGGVEGGGGKGSKGKGGTALTVLGGITAATLAVDTILGEPGSSLGGFKALLMGPESYSEWSKKNAPGFQRFFSMTLPGWLTAGGTRGWSSFKDAFYNTFGDEAGHWFSITLPNAINLGSSGSGGWAGLATNLGKWFGETLPGHLSPGEGKGWSGLVSSTGRWFSHTLPDAINVGQGSGWTGAGTAFGKWWGTTLPGKLSPGTGKGWSGLVGDTERWFSHTLPDAMNLGEGSGWAGLRTNLGNWFGQTLPDALSPGAGGGWKGAGRRWRSQAKDLLGVNLAQGLWEGFTSRWNGLDRSIRTFVADTIGGRLRRAFSSMAGGVRTAFTAPFSLVPQHLASPLQRVIDFLNGVIDRVNRIIPGSSLDIPHIGSIIRSRQGMGRRAHGGPVHGPGTGTSDDVPILASNGEYVLRAKAVARLGLGFVEAMNNADRATVGGDPSAMWVRPRFADGGLISRTQQFIRGTDPLPYVWGSVGPGSYDCSGLVGEVWARLTGHPSYRRHFTTANVASGFGFRPGRGTFTIGLSDSHVVGNLAGLAFEAESSRTGIKTGAAASSVGSMPRQYYLPETGGQFVDGGGGRDAGWWSTLARAAANTALRPFGRFLAQVLPDDRSLSRASRGIATAAKDRLVDRVASFDSGGPLLPGWTLAHNGTGRVETVRTSGQEHALDDRQVVQHHYHFEAGSICVEARTIRELNDLIAMLSALPKTARKYTIRRPAP